MNVIFPSAPVRAGDVLLPLPQGRPFEVTYAAAGAQRTVDDFFTRTNATGLLVIKDGQVVMERYAYGYTDRSAGSSRSMAKTFAGTLIGAALRDGFIRSLDDKVGQYVPELADTMYGTVSVRDLLTMTSGVPYREDPSDRRSDLFPLQACTVKGEQGCLLRFVRELGSRKAAPRSRAASLAIPARTRSWRPSCSAGDRQKCR